MYLYAFRYSTAPSNRSSYALLTIAAALVRQRRFSAKMCGHEKDGDVRNSRAKTLRGIKKARSEEHTSELQSQSNLVCRLLLEKKKKNTNNMSRLTRSSRPRESVTSPDDP